MAKWKYGMKMRGFSIGCQPMSGLRDVLDDKDGVYWNILGYDRELTPKEIEAYELRFLGKTDD